MGAGSIQVLRNRWFGDWLCGVFFTTRAAGENMGRDWFHAGFPQRGRSAPDGMIQAEFPHMWGWGRLWVSANANWDDRNREKAHRKGYSKLEAKKKSEV
jgi:hypothetical protein